MDQEPAHPQAVPLHDAGVPADHGLSTLGLIMQLGGSLFAAFMSLSIFTAIVRADGQLGGELAWLMLILGSCAVRSLFHRAAGTELLYGKRDSVTDVQGSPLAGLQRYIVVGLVHSLLMALFLVAKWKMPLQLGIAVGAGFALWPTLLAVLLASGRFKHLKDGIPVAEDKGFEGVSILMTIMGLTGTMVMGLFLFLFLKEGGDALSSGHGILILAAVTMLFIRSILHVQAGFSGLRETSLDRSVERANRYANFGMIAAFSAAGALLLITLQAGGHLLMFVVVALVAWMLLTWPLIVRRFFSDRQFADLLAGDGAIVHRRAPDAGLTGLGWFLLGYAVLGGSMMIPELVVGEGGGALSQFDMLGKLFGASHIADRSIWWNVGVLALQAWAGFELIRMSPVHRIVATAFGVVAAAVTVYQWFPALQALEHLDRMSGGMDDIAMMYLPLGIALMVPVATILLVNRKIAPVAKARFRSLQR